MPTSRPVLLGFLVSFFLHGALVFFLWDIRGGSEGPHDAVAEARPPLVQVRLVEASSAPASRRPADEPATNRILQEQEKGKRNKKAQVANRTHFEDLPPVEPVSSAALPPVAPPVPQAPSPSRAAVAPVAPAPASEPILTTAASGEADPADVALAPPSSAASVSQTVVEPEPGESIPAAPPLAVPPPVVPPPVVQSDSESTAPAFKNKGSLLRSLDQILQEEKRAAAKQDSSDDTDSTGEGLVTDTTPQTETLLARQESVANQAASELAHENAPLSTLEILRLRRQIGLCWNPPIGALGARDLKIRIDLDLREDATIERYQLIDVDDALGAGSSERADVRPAVRRAFYDSVKRALHHPDCQKLDLPPGRFEAWHHLGLFFSVAELLGYVPS